MTNLTEIQTGVIVLTEETNADSSGPFRKIAGLMLLQRQLLWLWQHHIAVVHLPAPPRLHDALRAHIEEWRKDRSIPEIVIHNADASVSKTTPERAVLLDGRFLHDPGLLARALSAEHPFVYVDDQGNPCGLGVVNLQYGAGADTLHSLPGLRLPAGSFAKMITNRKEAKKAESILYRSFIKSTDGWFSKNLDRAISLRITRLIIHLPLHPHVITLFTLLVGIASGWISSFGSFACLAVGGVLFELASILDGVDGEVARAKLLSSKTGEWMDTVCDDLTNAAFILGLSLGVSRMTPDGFWLAVGSLSLVIYGVTLFIMYGNLIIDGRQGTLLEFQEEIRSPGYRQGRMKSWLAKLQPFIKRDFYGYAFMILCLLGLPKIVIAGWSIGAILTLVFIWPKLKPLLSLWTYRKSLTQAEATVE
ncbi:MAG: CDP-alcohol phosphatidyltransferase family protein [Syntrophobacteraceae bacterium]